MMTVHILDTDEQLTPKTVVRSNCGQEGEVDLVAMVYTPDDEICPDCMDVHNQPENTERLSVAVISR